MKRFFLYLFILILLLLAGVYGLLFTPTGNQFVAKFAQKELQKSLPGAQIKQFQLSLSKLNLQLEYANMLEANIGGDISLASLSINLLYDISSKNLERIGIKEEIKASGKIFGKYNDLSIDGAGEILGSKLDFSAKLERFLLGKIKLNLDNADLGKIAKIAKMPILSGRLDANVNAQTIKQLQMQLNGFVNFLPNAEQFTHIALNELGKIDFGVNTKYENNELKGEGKISSKILNINMNDIKYKDDILTARLDGKASHIKWINPDLNTNLELSAQLKKSKNILDLTAEIFGKNINIKDIKAQANLENLDAELTAKISADSELLSLPKSTLANASVKAKLSKGTLTLLEANGIALGGNLIAKLADNRLSASIKHASIEQALIIAKSPLALTGHFDAEANISNISAQQGKITLNLGGKTNPKYFQKELNLPINSQVFADAKAELKGANQIDFSTELKSTLIDTFSAAGTLKNSTLSANYQASSKLANFNQLLGKNFSGEIALSGQLALAQDGLKASLNSEDFLGAQLAANLANEHFSASLQNASIPRFAKAFDFADIYAATAKSQIEYNLKTASGTVHAELEKGHLQPHPILELINAASGQKLDKITFTNGVFNSQITAQNASLDALLQAPNALLRIDSGEYKIASKKLFAPLILQLGKTTIKGALEGKNDKIKFVPDAQNAAQNILNLIGKISGKNSDSGEKNDQNTASSATNSGGDFGVDLSTKKGRKNAAQGLLKSLLQH